MDIVFFFGASGFCIGVTGTILYLFDQELAKKITYDMGFWTLEKYGSLLNWIGSYNSKQCEREEYYIVYKDNIQKIVNTLPIFNRDNLVIYKTTIENKSYYKII